MRTTNDLPLHARHAFTLVELSIVLVILGLLVGGVLTGQSLIRAAELRSINTQFQTFQTATMTFRDKYFGIPGDITNASAYWGAADGSTGNTAGCASVSSTTTATCNGNGDGKINLGYSSYNETFGFWKQLANAGLIEGSYIGTGVGTINGHTKANVPSGRINPSLWFVNFAGVLTSNPPTFDGDYGNVLGLGGIVTNDFPQTAFLKPDDAYNIDVKMDDGKPAQGKVRITASNGLAGCTDVANGATTSVSANYRLNSTAVGCALLFTNAF